MSVSLAVYLNLCHVIKIIQITMMILMKMKVVKMIVLIMIYYDTNDKYCNDSDNIMISFIMMIMILG